MSFWASHSVAAPPVEQTSSHLEVDVSGNHGLDGQDGHSYSRRASPGQPGADGGNATEPTPGQSAGEISEAYISSPSPGSESFWLEVKGITPERRTFEFQSQPLDFTGIPQVSFVAIGGNGGDGANGGDGQQGGKGADGRDATQWSDGTDGSDGGRGGDPGLGTSGADPGHGGNVTIRVPINELELLTLIESQTFAGEVGLRGSHGEPGPGGPGGKGGGFLLLDGDRNHH